MSALLTLAPYAPTLLAALGVALFAGFALDHIAAVRGWPIGRG